MSPCLPHRFLGSAFPFLFFLGSCEEKRVSKDSPTSAREEGVFAPPPKLPTSEPEVVSNAGQSVEGGKIEQDAGELNHEAVVEKLFQLQKGFVDELRRLVVYQSVEGFKEGLPARQAEMWALLQSAKDLPAPSAGEKAFYQTAIDAFADQSIPMMDGLLVKVRQLPEDHEIRKIVQDLARDKKMSDLKDEFEDLYRK